MRTTMRRTKPSAPELLPGRHGPCAALRADAARLRAGDRQAPRALGQTETATRMIQTRTVTDDEAEIRLDRWFRRHFPGTTQGVIQRLCRTGQVRVDGKRAEAATRLLPGQAVRIPPVPQAAAPASASAAEIDPNEAKALQRAVLYRDDELIVLDKPFGLPV